MSSDDGFDALGAAAELEAALAQEGASVRALEADLIVLHAKLADTERALAAAEARADHAEAEIARAGERLEREAERELARRSQRVFVDMIAVLDDLDRALEAARAAADASALLRGVELVQRRFVAALADHGVVRFAAAGEPFDPAVHEAVAVVEAGDARQDGRVVSVVRPGYRIGEQLLRAASVVVGKLQTHGS